LPPRTTDPPAFVPPFGDPAARSTIDPSRGARRRHAIFLGTTAAIAVFIIVLAHSVLLPFVLALLIAYVLTPAVAWVETKRVSRPLAIILVYIVVFGSLGGFIRLSAPRVVHELANLRRELPVISRTIRTEWVPELQQRLRAVGLGDVHGPAVDRDGDGREDPPAIVARQRPDGSFAIELQGPLAINAAKGGGYTVEPVREVRAEPFDLDHWVADIAGKSISYAQHNALEVVKLGRDIIAGVSRFFFIFGLTLMLAAYTMLTRDRIHAFFTSLVRPSGRQSWHLLLRRIDLGLTSEVKNA
jgi:predicted PurR-regulated permease PerM